MPLTAGEILIATDTAEAKSEPVSGDLTLSAGGVAEIVGSAAARTRLGLGNVSTQDCDVSDGGTTAGSIVVSDDNRLHKHTNNDTLNGIEIAAGGDSGKVLVCDGANSSVWTEPDDVSSNRLTKPAAATEDNIATFDASREVQDSGVAISSKVSVLIGATQDNFASITAGGSIQDSGVSAATALDRWTALVLNTDYDDDPGNYYWDGAAVATMSQWSNATVYTLGETVYSATATQEMVLECVVAGTSAASEPTFPAEGSQVVDNTVTWLARSTHVIKMLTDKTATIWKGMPVKIELADEADSDTATVYGIVHYINANRLVVTAPAIYRNWKFTGVYYGRPEMAIVKEFIIPSTYSDGTDATLLVSDNNTLYDWMLASAWLADVQLRHKVADTGANQP